MKWLVVDKFPVAIDGVELVLKDINENHQLLRASNGIEAIDQFIEYSPDFLITDLDIPHISGIELISKVRKLGSTIPIIVFSEGITPNLIKNNKELNVSAWIDRTIIAKDFKEKIKANLP